MVDVRVELLVLSFDKKQVAILRISDEISIQIHFCYSQVSVTHCLQQVRNNGFPLNSKEISAFVDKLDSLLLPDFDEIDEVSFDSYTSGLLSESFDDVAYYVDKPKPLEDQFGEFQETFSFACLLPSLDQNKTGSQRKNDFDERERGFYMDNAPAKEAIFHSKMGASEMVRIYYDKKVKRKILRSSLPDDSLYSTEWIHGPPAQLFGFLIWLTFS